MKYEVKPTRERSSMRRFLPVAVATALALWLGYSLGSRQGNRDALDCEFSAVLGGKVVPVGHSSTMLRARMTPLRPTQNVNLVSKPFALTHK